MADSTTAIWVALIGVGSSILTVWLNHHFDVRRKQLTGEIPAHRTTPTTFADAPRSVAQSADRYEQTKSFLKTVGILVSIMVIGVVIFFNAEQDSGYIAGVLVVIAALFCLFFVRVPAHLKKKR
jgi:peptidoglycan/LPS O-acetylase OafA/YrhL